MIALSGIAVQSKIYESSTSLVYRGIRVQDERSLVVKMLKQDYPSSQELTRYRQEYEITRFLNLEGVVKAYNQQDYQRTLVILLEDFGGESLEQWMHKRPDFCPMPLSTFLRLAIDLTDILGRIHAANVIHKDINPGNIVLNLDTGVVKIIDFGIATQFNRTNPTFKSLLFTGFVALSFAHAPKLIQGLMLCYATETLIVAIISYWWKITYSYSKHGLLSGRAHVAIWRDRSSLLSTAAARESSTNCSEAAHDLRRQLPMHY